MSAQIALRIAQVAEAVFAALALVFTLSLPIPADGFEAAWAFWLAITLVAAWVAWRLHRPTRVVWLLAAVLSAVILSIAVYSLVVIADPAPPSAASAPATSQTLAGIARLMQLIVALCLCWAWIRREDLVPRAQLSSASVPHN